MAELTNPLKQAEMTQGPTNQLPKSSVNNFAPWKKISSTVMIRFRSRSSSPISWDFITLYVVAISQHVRKTSLYVAL